MRSSEPYGETSNLSNLIDTLVRLLFYGVLANTTVLFFLQGGYDFTWGPFHVHAAYLKDWLMLLLALALAHALLSGRRMKVPPTEWIQSPLLLFTAVIAGYYVNGRVFESGDTLPARYLPVSLIRDHNFYLDEFVNYFSTRYQHYFVQSLVLSVIRW